MSENAASDPFLPLIESLCNSELFCPDLLKDDCCLLQGEFSSPLDLDLEFDGINWDISVDDILNSESSEEVSPQLLRSCDDSPPTDFDLSTSTPVIGDAPGVADVRSPESGHSANYSAESGGMVKREETNEWGTKRKTVKEDENANSSVNSRRTKFRRSEETNTCVFNSGNEGDEKRSARLMRNRESAQLSRQRKKNYVEELEEKVRSMHSTIAELNNKISVFISENATLKQQLGGNGSCAFPSGICARPAVTPMHFPWIPFPGIAFRHQSSSVPLVPIPKLKPQQPINSAKVKKSESKKIGGKTKKVASISLLGFLFVILICKGLVGQSRNDYLDNSHVRILSVNDPTSRLNFPNELVLNNTKDSGEKHDLKRITNQVDSGDKPITFDGHAYSSNSSETLPAFLYVSRNGKHVKINGNLIINSVLATEKAVSQSNFENQAVKSNEDLKASFKAPGDMASALALSKSGSDIKRQSDHHQALDSDLEDATMEASSDGPLQQWFREGLAGPVFRSGTCTEVFQFEISPAGIFPASSPANSSNAPSDNTTKSFPPPSHPRKKNRRILYPRAIPLAGTTLNKTEHLGKSPEPAAGFPPNSSATSIIVSVLVDPRDAGEGDADEVVSAKKALSRIFVVVLLDSVKYVTYSCVLPFMSPATHLVG